MFVGDLPPFADNVAERLVSDKLIPAKPDQMIINEYEPGQGISAHIDCESCFEDFITTISLGWEYEMDLIDTQSDRVASFMLKVGIALVFSGESRNSWQHRIRARKSDHGVQRRRRVSLTFRRVILDKA